MGSGLSGFIVQSAPPDTDGDIGPNHYVQIVNSGVTVFSRTGAKLLGPVNTNTFWSGFGGACATTNDGDGTIRYDRIADRWVIEQFSVNGGNGPFFQCIAVSTGPDPTGSYARYQFSYPAFNDYPKMALWPDGYYVTFNMFPNNTFGGAKVCAYDRVKMLTGSAATQQCFDTSNQFGGLLAADLDGPTLPPGGSPNFIGAIDTTAIDFWRMHVDFTTPSNSTFVGPTMIPVAAYTPLCHGGTCVVQPGTTQQLDSLADRAMNRFVYRNFGDHEALLMSHAVTAGSGGGVRWYELRSPATAPTIFQQGTYAPDSAFRWMSSIAFDHVGNIGICFSISSSTIHPSIRYTGRLAADPLGTMGQGEATIITGIGSQTGANLSRWGDYATMNIDSTDDCTFWCTSEYLAANGAFNWRTRIAWYRFLNCSTQQNDFNDFSITSNPTSQFVEAGSSVKYTTNTTVTSGSAQNINLSVSGIPTGVIANFAPATITAGGSSVLNISADSNTRPTTSQLTITITGTGTNVTRTTNALLGVSNSCNNDFYSASGMPMPIPDNNQTGINSSIDVVCSGSISSISISFDIDHQFCRDLVVALKSPNGTIVDLSALNASPCTVVTDHILSEFDGETAAGPWMLSVKDESEQITGSLKSWSLKISN